MLRTQKKILCSQQNRGLFFDGCALAGGLFLVPALSAIARDASGDQSTLGLALLLGIVLHCAGAIGKRGYLPQRLCRSAEEPEPAFIWYILLFILLVMHLGLFMACMSFGVEVLGLKNSLAPGMFPLTMIVATFPTILTITAMVPKPQAEPQPEENHGEAFTDLMLAFSLMPIFAFWDGFFVEDLAGKAQGSILMSLLLVLLTSVPFAMFYLAPRILYLVEDYRRPSTWLQIALVAIALSWKLIA